MIITGQIKSKIITSGKSDKGAWERCAFEINDKKYSTFDKDLYSKFNEGDFVEMETKTQGKYENMVSMKKVDNKAVKAPSEFHLSVEQSRCNAIQLALKHAEITALKASSEQILTIAGYFLIWILDGPNLDSDSGLHGTL